MIAAAPVALAALPAVAHAEAFKSATGADLLPPAVAAPSRDDLYREALDYVLDELGVMQDLVRDEPEFLKENGAWMGLWSVFFGSVGQAKADAIEAHGEVARLAWEDAGDVLYRALTFAVDEVKAE